jgi:porin
VALLARTLPVALVMASFGCSAILAGEPSAAVFPPAITSATTPSPDFESLRVKGLNIALPGPQDTIDPDFAGIRSSLASFGIGYIGWSSNSFYNNMLSADISTCLPQDRQNETYFRPKRFTISSTTSRPGVSHEQSTQ